LLLVASNGRAATLPTNFSDQLVASGLNAPTAFAFLPDGRALVTEQTTGAIRMVVGSTVTAPLATVPSLNTGPGDERGLLSIAVDPGWPARPYVYVHYSHTSGELRLVRYTGVGTLTGGASTSLALDSLYLVLTAIPDNTPYHNGGTQRFGPDGRLYFSLGEDGSQCSAQDITSMRGCVLRLSVNGLPGGAGGPPNRSVLAPADNPFAGNPNAVAKLVYAFGMRNPFRFQIDRTTGLLYVADVGETGWEEMDEVSAGENEGWAFREGPVSFPTSCTPLSNPVYDPPIDSYDHSEGVVIISAGMYRSAFHSTSWPSSYEGDVLYADYYYGFMRRLHKSGGSWQRIDASGQVGNGYWASGLNTPVDFQWGPDGHLWWLSQGAGELRKIVGSGNVAVEPPGGPARLALAASPNPARGRIELGFDLPTAGRIRIGVYDLAGRRVTLLAEGSRTAGHHALNWDGRDASGRLAPAGIYVVRLEANGSEVTTRITRLD